MSSSRGSAGTSSPREPRSAASRSVARQVARLSGEGAGTQRSASCGSRVCSKAWGSPGIRRKTPRPGPNSASPPNGIASARILRRPWLSCPIVASMRARAWDGASDAGRVVTRSDRKVTAASAAVKASGSSSGSEAKSTHSASAPAASKAAPSASHSPRSSGCRASRIPTLTVCKPCGCATRPAYVSSRPIHAGADGGRRRTVAAPGAFSESSWVDFERVAGFRHRVRANIDRRSSARAMRNACPPTVRMRRFPTSARWRQLSMLNGPGHWLQPWSSR